MLFSLQDGQFGRGGGIVDRVIDLRFESSNGSTTFTDLGSAGSTWSAVGSAQCSTTVILDDTASLKIPSCTADAISASYTSANRIPATLNWDFRADVYTGGNWATGGTGKTLFSCQDAGATAAGTAFAFATSSSALFVIILSDGSTRSVIATQGSAPMGSGTKYPIIVRRRGDVISGRVNGVDFSGSFTGSINMPGSSPVWRIGNTLFGNSGSETWYLDNITLDVYR